MSEERVARIESLLSQYQTAIREGIVEDIMKTGELYFTTLRDGQITEADKETIQNEVLLCAARHKVE